MRFLLILSFLVSFNSMAFGEFGHKLVCDIAWRSMSDYSRKQVIQLLNETRYNTFAEACVWADRIRSIPGYDIAKPHHYINVPRGSNRVANAEHCGERGCVVSAINSYREILSGNKVESSLYFQDKSKALMFLGHFVADIHQPLHVSYSDDWGGNKVELTSFNRSGKTNLHSFWDASIIHEGKDVDWKDIGEQLFSEITEEDKTRWAALESELWANESFEITKKIYRDLPRNRKITEAYYETYNAVALERIKMAGYRLGLILDSIFFEPVLASEANYFKTKIVEIYGGEFYADVRGKGGDTLHKALHLLIREHRVLSYKEVYTALEITDEDPYNSNNVILLYTGRSQSKSSKYQGGRDNDSWNREHVWPKSRGFPRENQHAYTDLHHLRPADTSVNSSRGSKQFDEGGKPHGEVVGAFSSSDSFEPPSHIKGDVARMIFYMTVAYDGNGGTPDLKLIKGSSSDKSPNFGHMCTLLKWHILDMPNDWERRRNERIYEIQGNRNPFVDEPKFAIKIWGSECQVE